MEFPWADKQEAHLLCTIGFVHHVCLLRHLHIHGILRTHALKVEAEVGKLVILSFGALASPDRLHLLAGDAVIGEHSVYHLDERLRRSHSEAHTVVKDHLLLVSDRLLAESGVLSIDGPVSGVARLLAPEDVVLSGTFLCELFKVGSSEEHLALDFRIVREIETEHVLEIFVELFAVLELGNKARNSLLKGVLKLSRVFLWGWSKTNKSGSLERAEISRVDNSQEAQVVKTVRVIIAEACSISCWVAHNCSLTILKHLSCLLVLLKVLALALRVLLVLSWTLSLLALLREQPCPSRSSVEDDLHLLGGVSKPELALVSHVHKVNHITLDDILLHKTEAMILLRLDVF